VIVHAPRSANFDNVWVFLASWIIFWCWGPVIAVIAIRGLGGIRGDMIAIVIIPLWAYLYWVRTFIAARSRLACIPADDRKWIRSLYRTWPTTMGSTGLLVARSGTDRRGAPLSPRVPELVGITPHPLGYRLQVRLINGAQHIGDYRLREPYLASALGKPVRVEEGMDIRDVIIILVTVDPLGGSRGVQHGPRPHNDPRRES